MTGLQALLPVAGVLCAGWSSHAAEATPPPNAPSRVEWKADAGRLRLEYHGETILEAVIEARDAGGEPLGGAAIKLEPEESGGGKDKVEQRLKLTLAGAREGVGLLLRGTVHGSPEAFPAETEGATRQRFGHEGGGVEDDLRKVRHL